MVELNEERVGFWLAVAGGLVFFLGAVVALLVGTFDVLTGRLYGSLTAGSEALLLLAFGALSLLFAYLSRRAWQNRPFTSAMVLIMVAVLGAITAGPGAAGLTLVGALFVGLGGVLFLIRPIERAVHLVATA